MEYDNEPVEASLEELEQRLGQDALEALARVRNDPDEAFDDTAEIEKSLIDQVREKMDLSKEGEA